MPEENSNKPFVTIIYVVIEVMDGPKPSVRTEQMFWSGEESDFEDNEISYAWRGSRLHLAHVGSLANARLARKADEKLIVRAANTRLHTFSNYDEQTVVIVGGRRIRVTTKGTIIDAEAYVDSLKPPSA